MELEAKFAALVARARGVTRLADPAGGQDHRVCEVLIVALCDLYDEGVAAGLDPAAIEEIANRYLEWDINNDPWPKPDQPPGGGNVVAFRRGAAWLEIARSARHK